MKTGIFVGSFNPITKAHLNIARHLYHKKIVNKIIFVPTVNNDKKLESLENRTNMINLVIDNKHLVVSDIMNNYSKFNYQVINELKKDYKDLYLIMGFDLIKKFKSFDNYLDLIKDNHIIVVNRDSTYKEMYKYIHKEYNDYLNNFILIDYHSKISSSKWKYKKNDYIINRKVLDYIIDNNLYK
ncbi:MAG: nicotinate-nicotinamide nucleotide adenylyltransferase [Bacilli bacterium]|nr:nicotinate-nicotinamide nucleotide adenylyltransferase [Bacilli bacterium]